ncbi:MAG: hypothetical protein A2Y75_01520 [Candidatus Solincola sediminis]|uniref:DUF1351 domain-containing protein n=1 Tax=Candidatus Solincola sediminis TaxID=1797199 RepID=A0A1F2WNJ3_9ACTN|nr:MAG: hypothetical protein A2Y75_01520 [Candidatus Solincola sediminis]
MGSSIQEYSKTEAALSILRGKYAGVVYDVASLDGMKTAKEARAELRGYRVELERVRKDIKAPALKRCTEIDTEAKRITRELSALEDPIDSAIKSEEGRVDREKRERKLAEERASSERVERERASIDAIRSPLLWLIGKPSSDILAQIKKTQAIDTASPEYGRPVEQVVMSAGGETHTFVDRAIVAKTETLAKLNELYTDAIKREEERARLAELEARHAAATEAREEVERAQFIESVAPVVDGLDGLRLEARAALADIVFRFADIPELSPVISVITAYLKVNP